MFAPLNETILLKLAEKEKTPGIFVAESAEPLYDKGEVIAVGPGRKLDDGSRLAMDVKVGDKVFFTRYAATQVPLDGDTFHLVKESDILGILS